MAQSSFAILEEFDRHFRTDEFQSRRLQHHFACVFPAPRRDVDSVQCFTGHAAYAAMDVGKVAAINPVQNPVRERRAEVTVQFRHRAFLDAASKPAAHDELRAVPEFLHERSDFAKIVS